MLIFRACLIGALLVSVGASFPPAADAEAEIRMQFEQIADGFAELGKISQASLLRNAVAAASDSELELIYGTADLGSLVDAVLQFRFQTETNSASDPRQHSSARTAWPEISDYASAECGTTGDSAFELEAALGVWLAAKGVWNVANRGCNEVVVIVGEGGNGSLACVAADIVLVTAEGIFRKDLMCSGNVEGARTKTVLARQDYLKTNQESIMATLSAMDTKIDVILADATKTEQNTETILATQLQQMMHQKGGSITTMLYTQRLDEACEAAQAAIDAADVLYKINGQAQILHDQGFALRATDPKKAYELCKKSYNHAAHKSKHLK